MVHISNDSFRVVEESGQDVPHEYTTDKVPYFGRETVPGDVGADYSTGSKRNRCMLGSTESQLLPGCCVRLLATVMNSGGDSDREGIESTPDNAEYKDGNRNRNRLQRDSHDDWPYGPPDTLDHDGRGNCTGMDCGR